MKFDNIEQVIEAIKTVDQVPDWVVKARDYHKKMKALIYGDKHKERILQIEHIETTKKAEARKKYSRPIKDANAKILEPVGNVYSATGGGRDYLIDSDTKKKEFISVLSNVRNGLSLTKWLETYWAKDLYNADPSGLMMLEWKDDRAYPTYKSIDKIRSYDAEGMSVNYVVFEPKQDKSDRYWRVVDSEKDYTIKQSGQVFTEVQEQTFDNPFGICPARVCSDKHYLGEEFRRAFIDAIVETEEEFLRDRSILTIYKFLNGFSTPYRPKIICPSCRGTKKNGDKICPDCNGKGVVLDKDVTDEIIIPIDLNSDNGIQLPPNFAGFISPDLEIWNQYIEEGKRMANEMFETTWGTRESEAKDQTAMSVILNTQPMTSKLNAISDVAQSHDKAFSEMMANFYLEKDTKEQICIISYGRNYIVQPPEFLLEQYQKSNEKKDPITIRDRKLVEYLTSKYKNDPETLRTELLKKDLEPYVHYDIETVNSIYGNKEAQKKGYFTDWWETLTRSDLALTVDKLESKRGEYFNNKIQSAIVPPETN